jgi:hypothetical protein
VFQNEVVERSVYLQDIAFHLSSGHALKTSLCRHIRTQQTQNVCYFQFMAFIFYHVKFHKTGNR